MENYYLVGLNEFKETDSSHQIVYTRDLCTCIVIVLHKEYSTVMFHVESYDKGNVITSDLVKYLSLNTDEILSSELFLSKYSDYDNVEEVKNILNSFSISPKVYLSPTNKSNQTTIGYSNTDNTFYSVTMDYGNPEFEEYKVPEELKLIKE